MDSHIGEDRLKLRVFLGSEIGFALFEGKEEEERNHADTNRRISHIEGWPMIAINIEI